MARTLGRLGLVEVEAPQLLERLFVVRVRVRVRGRGRVRVRVRVRVRACAAYRAAGEGAVVLS